MKDKIKQYFRGRKDVLLAYIFGSRTDGNFSPESDFDFGLLLQEGSDKKCRYEIAHELGELLNSGDVDIVLMDGAPVELAYNIISEGRLIYERSQRIRVDYESRIMSKYCDYLPVLRAQRKDVLREAGR